MSIHENKIPYQLQSEVVTGRSWFHCYRFVVLVLMFLATLVSYVLRVNINIAIVDMMDVPKEVCNNATKSYVEHNGEFRFCWTEEEKGNVLGAFFYGYVVLMIPSGAVAERFGSKLILGVCLLLTTILSIVTPLVAYQGPSLLIALRVVQGLCSSCTYPALPPLIKRWCYASELATFIAVAYVGGTFGTAITYPIAGVLLDKFGWMSMFYFSGVVGLAWFVLWMALVTNDPSDNRLVSKVECQQIEAKRQQLEEEKPTSAFPPIHKILSIPTVWICALSEFGYAVGVYFVIIEGPTFIKEVLGKDITTDGVLNALPNLATLFYSQLFAMSADYSRKRGWLSRPASIRVFEAIGMVIPSLGCLAISQSLNDWTVVIILMCLLMGCRGACYSGRNLVPFDVTPAYAGVTYGFINMVGQCAGFITPLMTSALTGGDPSDPAGWKTLFYVAFALMMGPFLLFITFARFQPVDFNTKKVVDDIETSPVYNAISIINSTTRGYGAIDNS